MIEVLTCLYGLVATAACLVLVKKCLDMSEKIESIEEQVNSSLDILDDCYSSIYQKSKLEVMSDEPIVRELMSDITRSRNAVLLVSRKINGDQEEDEEK